jgi:hypothetical protein
MYYYNISVEKKVLMRYVLKLKNLSVVSEYLLVQLNFTASDSAI